MGIRTPPTPIDATTYATNGYPFFEIYEEGIGVFGHFPIQSVATLDKAKGKNEDTHEAEKDLTFPSIMIPTRNSPNSHLRFEEIGGKTTFLRIRSLESKTLGL
jgi:hypothetical protein